MRSISMKKKQVFVIPAFNIIPKVQKEPISRPYADIFACSLRRGNNAR